MPTSYPGALDAFVNPTAADTLSNPPHDGQHTNINDAVEAIEAELGVNPRGAFATVRARLDGMKIVVANVAALPSSGISDGEAAYLLDIHRIVTRTNGRWYLPFHPFTNISKTTGSDGLAEILFSDVPPLVQMTMGMASVNWQTGTGAGSPVLSVTRFTSSRIGVRVYAIVSGDVQNYQGSAVLSGWASGYVTT